MGRKRAILKYNNGVPAISFPPQEENHAKSHSPENSCHGGLANQGSPRNRNAAVSITFGQDLLSMAVSYSKHPSK